MSQTVDNIKPSYPLFREQEYKDNLSQKQETVEDRHDPAKIQEVFEWTTTEEYKELNFKREALTVNPAKACQPLGAVLVRPRLREDPALCARLPGMRGLFPHLLQPPFQGAHRLRVRLHDRGRGGLRRPEEHVRRPGECQGPLQARR